MQQVSIVFDKGVWDYSKISGDSGPLVYPAGFVYVFRVLQMVCGSDLRREQIVFAIIYMAQLILTFWVYRKAGVNNIVPYVLLILSKRIHSIYVLRMFNDCVAMLLCYIALALLMSRRWRLSSLCFSLSVAVKMNTLLFAPAIGLIILVSEGFREAVICGSIMAALQMQLALPFLLVNPVSYLTCAFDFGRQFLYQWTVNWKFLPKEDFDNPIRGKILLAVHVCSLLLWASYRFAKRAKSRRKLMPAEIFKLAAECNLIGIICARSLHYQFYSWYFHTIPFMLWSSSGHVFLKVFLFALIEWCWNVFPATPVSSALLLISNMSILIHSLLS